MQNHATGDTTSILVRVGLTNLNSPSTDNLNGQAAGSADQPPNSVFDHKIRSIAPVNYLEPVESKTTKVVP